jgi:hypothetical protein
MWWADRSGQLGLDQGSVAEVMMRRWYYKKRFLLAYRILRNANERHRALGHNTEFHAVDEVHIFFECSDCPDMHA